MNVEKKKSIHAQNIPHWKSQAWKSTMNDETNKNKIQNRKHHTVSQTSYTTGMS